MQARTCSNNKQLKTERKKTGDQLAAMAKNPFLASYFKENPDAKAFSEINRAMAKLKTGVGSSKRGRPPSIAKRAGMPDSVFNWMFPNWWEMSRADRHGFLVTHSNREVIDPRQIGPEDLKQLPIEQLWVLTRLDMSTLYRYRRGDTAIPYAVQQLVRLALDGVLPYGLHRELKIDVGALHGHRYSIDEFMALGFWKEQAEQAAFLEQRLAQVQAENERLRAQQQPAEIAQGLEALQARITAMLASMKPGKVIPFPTHQTEKEAAA